jgi:hypothetical protein
MSMQRTGLDDFKDFVKSFQDVGAYVSATAAVALPITAMVLKLGPPWPNDTFIAVVTLVAELIVLILVFASKVNQKQSKGRLRIAVMILCISFLAYCVLYSSFTGSYPGDKGRYVRGFILQPQVQQLVNAEPTYTVEDALSGAEYRREAVWVEWSITTMGVLLLVLWTVSFCSLVSCIATFTLLQQRKISVSTGEDDKAQSEQV